MDIYPVILRECLQIDKPETGLPGEPRNYRVITTFAKNSGYEH